MLQINMRINSQLLGCFKITKIKQTVVMELTRKSNNAFDLQINQDGQQLHKKWTGRKILLT